MRTLSTQQQRGAFLVGLSVGEKLKLTREYMHGETDSDIFDAEVIEHDDDKTIVQVANELLGGQIVGLTHVDGESMVTEIDGRSCWYFVAVEQPDHEEPALTGTIEESEPSTALALNLPRGASWLLEQATILDGEAAKYRQYSPPQMALSSAAQNLRSAVGHVLAGGCEKEPATPAPF